MLTARQGMAVAVLNDLIYVIGGQINDTTITDIVEVYDPIQDKWQSKAPIPTKRSDACAASYNP